MRYFLRVAPSSFLVDGGAAGWRGARRGGGAPFASLRDDRSGTHRVFLRTLFCSPRSLPRTNSALYPAVVQLTNKHGAACFISSGRGCRRITLAVNYFGVLDQWSTSYFHFPFPPTATLGCFLEEDDWPRGKTQMGHCWFCLAPPSKGVAFTMT